MTHRHIFKRQCTGRPQKGRSRGLICEYIMSWCQPNEILFEALTVSFCIGPVWVKRVCTSRSAMVGSYPLGYSGRNKVWVLLDYIYIIIYPSTLHVTIYPFLVALWFARLYFAGTLTPQECRLHRWRDVVHSTSISGLCRSSGGIWL